MKQMSSNMPFFSIYPASFSLENRQYKCKAFCVFNTLMANHRALSGKISESGTKWASEGQKKKCNHRRKILRRKILRHVYLTICITLQSLQRRFTNKHFTLAPKLQIKVHSPSSCTSKAQSFIRKILQN